MIAPGGGLEIGGCVGLLHRPRGVVEEGRQGPAGGHSSEGGFKEVAACFHGDRCVLTQLKFGMGDQRKKCFFQCGLAWI